MAEYIQLCRAVGVGFLVMGFIGYFVKVSLLVSWCPRGDPALSEEKLAFER